MSQANELLDSITEDEVATRTASPKTEPHIIVDEDRFITVPDELKRIAVEHDHNIETVIFDCPRYWDEHDMSQMKVCINYMRADGGQGCYVSPSVYVDETDDNLMHFTWTVSRHVTYIKGELTFLVCVKNISEDGTEVNHWNSELNREMYISEGLECDVIMPDGYPTQERLLNITENGTVVILPEDGYMMSKVIANVAVGVEPERKDVNFYDYDGTLLYSYTFDEVKQLTELPTLPSRKGLYCQGWNYDLESIKTYEVPVDVGAMYITDNGTTRFYIYINSGERSDMTLQMIPTVPESVKINWGVNEDWLPYDEITEDGVVIFRYRYASPGYYTVSIKIADDCTAKLGYQCLRANVSSGSDLTHTSSILYKVEIGSNILGIDDHAFFDARCLKSVTLPKHLTYIAQYAFMNCHKLRGLVVSSEVTSIERGAFYRTRSLVVLSLPEGISSMPEFMCDGSGIEHINIPKGVLTIGNNCFDSADITSMIHIPYGVTAIGRFAFCGLMEAGPRAYFPATVEYIGASAFDASHGITLFDFSSHTAIPTLENHTAFGADSASNILANYPSFFLVPETLYDEWITAEHWSVYADYILAV